MLITIILLVIVLIAIYYFLTHLNERIINIPNENKEDFESNNLSNVEVPVKINNAEYGIYESAAKEDQINKSLDNDLDFKFNLCSKSCCTPQYPLPFSIPIDKMTCESEEELYPSNYTCNNSWQDTGCLCLTKSQTEFLGSKNSLNI
jgi:hypothetical protein